MDSCELGAGQGGERGWVGGRGLHWPPQLRLHASGSGRRVEASTPGPSAAWAHSWPPHLRVLLCIMGSITFLGALSELVCIQLLEQRLPRAASGRWSRCRRRALAKQR